MQYAVYSALQLNFNTLFLATSLKNEWMHYIRNIWEQEGPLSNTILRILVYTIMCNPHAGPPYIHSGKGLCMIVQIFLIVSPRGPCSLHILHGASLHPHSYNTTVLKSWLITHIMGLGNISIYQLTFHIRSNWCHKRTQIQVIIAPLYFDCCKALFSYRGTIALK